MNIFRVLTIALAVFFVSAAAYAEDSNNTFEARAIAPAQPDSQGQSQPPANASPQPLETQRAAEEPDYISVGGKVIKNPKKLGSSSGAMAPETQSPTAAPAADEPNFIVVGGKVVPNPNKQGVNPPAAAPGGEEPNFIVVNGQVIPNPNKKRVG